MQTSFYRRKFVRTVAGAFALTLLCTGAAFGATNIGNTQVVVNDVKGVMGSQEPTVLRAGIDVFQNEVIRTGPRSASRVVFQDDTRLEVGASSQVTLDRFVFDPDPAKSAVALSIAKGVARFTTGTLPKSSYQITTPTATIGVRGTIVTITVAEDGTTTISVEDGIAVVSSGGQTVEVGQGMSTTVSQGVPPSPPTPTPPMPPVDEMNTLLADNNLPLAPGDAAKSSEAIDLGGIPVGVVVAGTAALVLIIVLSSSSSSGTH